MSGYAGCATAKRGMRERPSKENTVFKFLSSILFSSRHLPVRYNCRLDRNIFSSVIYVYPHPFLKIQKYLFYKTDVLPENI